MISLISITLLLLLSKVEGSDCEGFRAAACPLTESNILGFDNKQDLASCQRQCQLNSNCNWFTRFLSIESELRVRCRYFQLCRPVLAADGLLLPRNLPGAFFLPQEGILCL